MARYHTYRSPDSIKSVDKLGMLGVEQTVDRRNDLDGHSAAPTRVSTPSGSPSPIIDGTDSAAELPWREATAPLLAATATRRGTR
jgi:hypothetical protein